MKLWIDDVRLAPEGYVWCKRCAFFLLLFCLCLSIAGCTGTPEIITEYIEVPVEKEVIKEIPVEVIVEKEIKLEHNWVWTELHEECGLSCSICGIFAQSSWQEHRYIYTVTQKANCYQNEKTTAECLRCSHSFSYISGNLLLSHNYDRKLIHQDEEYKIENKCIDCGTVFYSYDFDPLCAFVEIRGLSYHEEDLSDLSWINLSVSIEKGHFSNQISYTCTLLNTTGIYGKGRGYDLNSIPGFNIIDGKNTVIIVEITDPLHSQTTMVIFSLGSWIQENKDRF